MRKFFTLALSTWLACSSFAQTKIQVKSDTVKITNGELAINNASKSIQGFLYNTGNGTTSFKRGAIKLDDTTYIIGADTLHIPKNENSLNNSLNSGHLFVGNNSNIAADVAMSGDVTINNTGVTSIGSNKVTDGMLRQSLGLSVMGRSANSTGNVADITGTDGQVLRVAGTTLGFGTLDNSSLTNSSINVATGTSGTDFNISGSPVSLGGTVTLNIPDAGSGVRGLMNTGVQTINGNKTFSGIFLCSSGGGFNTGSRIFRTTDGGSNITSTFMVDIDASSSTAGSQGVSFETATGFAFTAANGTRRIARAALKLVNLNNTAGSETGDLAFYTKPSGGAIAEAGRFTAGANFLIGSTSDNGSRLQVNGSISLAYVAKTAAYTLTASDYIVDATSGTFTLTLPTAVGITGRTYTIKNSGTGTTTIATTSSQTIDGANTKTLSTRY